MIDELVLWQIDALAVIGYTLCWFFCHRWSREGKSLLPQILVIGGVSIGLMAWPLMPWVGGSFFGSVRILSWLIFGCIPAVLLSCWWQQKSRSALVLSLLLIAIGVDAIGRAL